MEAWRGAIFGMYEALLGGVPGVEFMPEAPWGECTRWLTIVLISPESFGADREAVRLALEAGNIEARPVWKPMHLQPVFAGARARGGAVAEDLFARGLCLPSGTAMGEGDVSREMGTDLFSQAVRGVLVHGEDEAYFVHSKVVAVPWWWV